MRTVKRDTYKLNIGKKAELHSICEAYAAEKQLWLNVFASNVNQCRIKQHREVRNEAIKAEYVSSNKLQARMWKLALIDASETWDKYYQAMFVDLKSMIAHNKSLDVLEKDPDPKKRKKQHQRHYLYWLLKSYANFTAALHGEIPEPTTFIPEEPKRLVRYLQKIVRKVRGKRPTAKSARSFSLDSGCYNIFQKNDVQYIKITTLTKGRRIVIPLSGNADVSGSVRVVVDKDIVRVHKPQKLAAKQCSEAGNTSGREVVSACDIGYTEVMADELGNFYGTEFGPATTAASNRRNNKGKHRNRLYALQNKHREAGNVTKANHIKRFNLGQKKQEQQTGAEKAHLSNIINASINRFLRERKPEVVVTEYLRNLSAYGFIKGMNRKLSSWLKGEIQDRFEFKALAEGFCHEQVNPAYSSQTCPICDYVAKGNRKGDRFKCLNHRCGYEGHADQVGAVNLLRRRADHEITRYTPYPEVKAILLRRYNRRLEAEDSILSKATVPGRTLEAVRLPLGIVLQKHRRSRSQGADLGSSVSVAA